MNIKEVFDLAVRCGVAADPRGSNGVKKYLTRIDKEYNKLSKEDREFFDKEQLTNPYSDSRVHFADEKKSVKRVLAGIDIGVGEILLASQLNERGKEIDLVIAHHPTGKSMASLHTVMEMQADIFMQAGVPVHAAEKIMEERMREVGHSVHPINHFQVADTARILGVNFINTHTITDNLVQKFLLDLVKKTKPETLGELIEELMKIEEYREARRRVAGPKIVSGNTKNRIGKMVIEMTGGTNPSNLMYQELANAGISTILGMHMKEDAVKKANDSRLNIVIAGHISSDSLGMNLFLDELEKRGIEIVTCSGLIRVSRVKKKK